MDKKFVYVVDAQNVVRSKPVSVAAELPHVYVVASGLDEQDKVLVDGLRKVRDGSKIAVDYKAPAEVLEHLDVPAE